MSPITSAPIIYSVVQVVAAFLLFTAAFVALLLTIIACVVVGRLAYVGTNWVRVRASAWDHSALDRYVTLHANAIGRPLFAWWSNLHPRH
jgi:hypothetical protein